MTRTSTKSTHIFSGHFILFGTYTVGSSIGGGVGLKPNYPFGVILWEIPSAPSIWGKNSERSEATFHMGKVLSCERGGGASNFLQSSLLTDLLGLETWRPPGQRS